MKKLIATLIVASSFLYYLPAQTPVTVPITLPANIAQTNLLDQPCILYSVTFNFGGLAAATNMVYALHDSPRLNTPRSGTATANILEYTNTGYATYNQYISNMNWLAAGSRPLLGVNSNRSPEGITMTITNSAVLSNYLVTVSNYTAGAVALRPVKATGIAISNTTTTVTFSDGLRLGMGLTLTNQSGLGAVLGGTVTLTYLPFR